MSDTLPAPIAVMPAWFVAAVTGVTDGRFTLDQLRHGWRVWDALQARSTVREEAWVSEDAEQEYEMCLVLPVEVKPHG